MAQEIEHKYLVDQPKLPPLSGGELIVQGYVPDMQSGMALRFRIKGDQGYVTLKISGDDPVVREEYETPVDVETARKNIYKFCAGHIIEKTRYEIEHDGHIWEVDVYHGTHKGLMTAEIELDHKDVGFSLPEWVRDDVTANMGYTNSSLAIKGLPRPL